MVISNTTSREYERFFPVFQSNSLGYDQRSLGSRTGPPSMGSPSNSSLTGPESIEVSLSEDSMFLRNGDSPRTSFGEDRNEKGNEYIPETGPKSKHQGRIASALGLSLTEKMLNFNNELEKKKHKYGISRMLSFASRGAGGISGDVASQTENQNHIAKHKKVVPEKDATLLKADTFVQAPGLRNDFYSSLISWSHINNKIAVGLNVFTYMWNLDNFDVNPILVDQYETVTCVSCSLADFLAIGTISGRVLLVSQKENFKVKAEYFTPGRNIHAISWFKDGNRFLVSDHSGKVQLLHAQESNNKYCLELQHTFSCHQQLVCGISINDDETQVAFGSNDNTASIWDIKDTEPKLKFILPHSAAIKAIAFCPWSTSLLATGGGTKDRTIRFWHSRTGTLISSYFTNSQVTSLSWSRFSKEIAATFGFGESKVLLSVYSYPDMKPSSQVVSSTELRILSATASPDGNSLCVATNDSTVRIYRLWSHKLNKHVPQPTGVYGSTLLELFEGVDEPIPVIR